MREIPLFAELIEDELAETIRLSNGVVVEVHTASIGAPRGRTFLAVLCDETAFWPMEATAPIRTSRSSTRCARACPRSLTGCSSSPPAPTRNEAFLRELCAVLRQRRCTGPGLAGHDGGDEFLAGRRSADR